MPDFGLFYKEWKQNKALLVIIILVFMLSNPFTVLNTYISYQSCVTHQDKWVGTCVFSINYLNGTFISVFWIWGVVLAISQLGIERSKGFFDFILSLPYTRGQIFNAKFLTGGMVIVGPQLIGYVLSIFLILLLNPEKVIHFHHLSIGMIFISLMAYSLVMAAGALTGNILSQLLVSFTVAIFPFLLIALPAGNLEIVFGQNAAVLNTEIPDWFRYIIPIMFVVPEWVMDSEHYLFFPIAWSFIFYIIGYISFVKLSNDRNGYFFLWKALDRPVQVIVIIIGILGFGYFGYAASESFAGYLLGMAAGAVIGFFISYFAIYKKTKYL
ncbi:ABC transporter permease subunit [Bacillus subtilis]|uniref:ABC transporter permease subunit n=1 Tax=Bacillus subtilis TaxID=1423 RepID=UPI0007E4E2C3|nr:ABC transporter permease subunit [Bacillus subtilis]MDF4197575.1 ABC transporter permease subunit [Bacillus subtilis]MDF4219209.1 ABC transporter permease subunit [Bacillus subtilis]MED3515214.1 ABC transporter permease subunit [Bacillus subtilis]MED3517644.1 ABC transporter permease subunit [Bacillus subtilis]OAY89093.1 ABC transporter permease [Bacillus subtilis subsp. subtilis]